MNTTNLNDIEGLRWELEPRTMDWARFEDASRTYRAASLEYRRGNTTDTEYLAARAAYYAAEAVWDASEDERAGGAV